MTKSKGLIPQIFVLHGMNSDASQMEPLKRRLEELIEDKNVCVATLGYEYRYELVECAKLAHSKITEACGRDAPIILIGHSQGGLVARLVTLMSSKNAVDTDYQVPHNDDCAAIVKEIRNFRKESRRLNILGVCTLATPNSGALTIGQMNALGTILSPNIKRLARFLRRKKNYTDLSTDRVFRAFQFFKTVEISYLSISGAAVNRFSSGGRTAYQVIALLSKNLEKPNDGVVVESSANLLGGPLPNEVSERDDVDENVNHLRKYPDCINVDHSTITSSGVVQSKVAKWVESFSVQK